MTDVATLLLPNQIGISSDVQYSLKPSCVRARSYRASIPTSNKSSFNAGDTAILYIPGGRKGTFLDQKQSYLRFTVNNLDSTYVANVDNMASSFINRIDIYHGSNLLETVQQYNVLFSAIKDCQTTTSQNLGLSNCFGTGNDATSYRQGCYLGHGQYATFCIPLASAVIGVGAEKMLPIGQLYDDIRVEITIASNTEALVWNNATSSGFAITDMQFVGQIVELSDEGLSMVNSVTPFSEPVYIHGSSWRHYASTLPASTTGMYSTLVPARFASLKGLLCAPRRSVEMVDLQAYSTSARVNPCISSYNWRIGSWLVPQRPVTIWNATNTSMAAEAFAELQKMFHGLNCPEMATSLNNIYYNKTDLGTGVATIGGNSTNGVASLTNSSYAGSSYTCAFLIGQELETFAHRDGLLLSGMNTLSSQVFFEANIGFGPTTQAPQVSFTLDFYANYDVIFVLENGIMSARF